MHVSGGRQRAHTWIPPKTIVFGGFETEDWNAMPGLHHREPGPVGAALERDDIILEVVADGMHVHSALIRTLFLAAPGRIALVTDAMPATGLGDGNYKLGGLAVEVRDGRPLLRGTSTLAGSTLTLEAAMATCAAAGVSAIDVEAAVSATPAWLLEPPTVV